MIKRYNLWQLTVKLLLCGAVLTFSQALPGIEKPLIFPIPQELNVTQESFIIDESISILVPENASEPDINLAKALVRELSDKYGVAIKIKATAEIPGTGRSVIMGTLNNSLIRKYCAGKISG